MRGRWFAGWIVVGALGALTVLGAAGIGVFVLPFFGFAFAFVARRTRYPLDMLGGIVGIGAVLLAIAYGNSDHQPCSSGFNCSGGLDPHPWLLAGRVFVTAGLGLYAALRAASRLRPCRHATS